MKKIVIENDTEMDDVSALYYAIKIVQGGRVSDHGKQYCYVTSFKNGVVVLARLTKGGTDVLTVTKLNKENT